MRGFMTANGQPDQSRSARIVLKDYVNGKLLYCYPPPNVAQDDFHTFPERTKIEQQIETLPPRQQRAMQMNKSKAKQIDDTFFQIQNTTAYVKGRHNFPNVRASPSLSVNPEMSQYTDSKNGSMISLAGVGEKPWKNRKKEKKEKLRNKYAYLDEH